MGKRIKCPACGASQLVERVAEAIVEAIPKAVIEENAAPAQKKEGQQQPLAVSHRQNRGGTRARTISTSRARKNAAKKPTIP